DRLTLGATLRFPAGKFTLIERNWFERRWREPQVDAWRYRIRGQIEHPFMIKKAKFTGYVSDEVFYDWSQHDWVRNRFAAGANHAFNKHFTLDLYLMRQNDGRTRPGDRKSTRLNSSHQIISYAVFCLKKKKKKKTEESTQHT